MKKRNLLLILMFVLIVALISLIIYDYNYMTNLPWGPCPAPIFVVLEFSAILYVVLIILLVLVIYYLKKMKD